MHSEGGDQQGQDQEAPGGQHAERQAAAVASPVQAALTMLQKLHHRGK